MLHYWYILGLRIGTTDRGSVLVAPNEFWSNWPQWKIEGYLTVGKCEPCAYDSPDLLITDKFRSAAVPEVIQ